MKFIEAMAYPRKSQDSQDVLFAISANEELDNDSYYNVLCISHNSKYKDRLDASMNLLVDMVGSLSNNKKSYESELNEQGINLEFVPVLKQLSNLLGYFINSTSWHEQNLQDFDIREFKTRLDQLRQTLGVENSS